MSCAASIPRWGPQRLRHELLRRVQVNVPSRASIYRVLGAPRALEPGARRKRAYRRWERDTAMQLWQLSATVTCVAAALRD